MNFGNILRSRFSRRFHLGLLISFPMPQSTDHHGDAEDLERPSRADPELSARGARPRRRYRRATAFIALALLGLWLWDERRLSRLEVVDAVASLEYGLNHPRCHGIVQFDKALLEYWHHRTAYRVLDRLARAGDPVAAYHLARMHWSGIGLDYDDNAALRWALYSAAHDHVPAFTMLGHMYRGNPPLLSWAESRRWHRQAAAHGVMDSIVAFNVLSLHGPDGSEHVAGIRDTLERAASQGNLLAGIALTEAHERGRFGQVNSVEAFRWMLWSGLRGHQRSMDGAISMLSGRYWPGDDESPEALAFVDLEAAYKWLLVSIVWYERDYIQGPILGKIPRLLLENYRENYRANYEAMVSLYGPDNDLVGVASRQYGLEPSAERPIVVVLRNAQSTLIERTVAAMSRTSDPPPPYPQFEGMPYRLSDAEMLRAEREAQNFLMENPQPPSLREVHTFYPAGQGGAFKAPLYCSDWRARYLR